MRYIILFICIILFIFINSLSNCSRKKIIKLSEDMHLMYFDDYDIYKIHHDSCRNVLDVEQIYFNFKDDLIISSYKRGRIDTLFQQYSIKNCSHSVVSGDSVVFIGVIKTRIRDLPFKDPEEYELSQ